MRQRIGAGQPDMPATGRAAVRQAQRHARKGIGRQQRPFPFARDQGGEGLHIQLHVGPLQPRPGAKEPAAVVDRQAQRPAPGQQVLHPDAQLAPPGPQRLVQRRHVHPPSIVDALMVVQMVAHIRIVAQHRQAQPGQQRAGTDARQLQDLRRVDRPARQNHLGLRPDHAQRTAMQHLDPHGATGLDHHPRHLRLGHHLQIGPLHRRAQKGARRRIAPAVLDRQLIGADPLLLRPVEIGHMRKARGLACGDVAAHQRMQIAQVFRDEQRPAAAPPGITARFGIFHRPVSRQRLVPAPAGIPRRRPILVIAAVPPDIDHRVDRG